MGGCCCCSSRSEAVIAPVYIYHQQYLEEHELLSSTVDESSPASVIVALHPNLDISIPDPYQAPPAPLLYDIGFAVTDNPDLEMTVIKSKIDDQQEHLMVAENGSCNKSVLEDRPDEEDVCPICLEEYDEENPCSITKCEHHFHLCCILEWMEQSDTCPVCDQITLIDVMFQ